jgi:hypothetical protein
MIRICEKYCIKILQLDLQYVFQMTISASSYILAHLWNHFSHCFLVYGSFVAHCIGHIDLQTSNPRILSVRPQVRSGVPLKCGSMRYIALSQFGCFSVCKIQSQWTDASCNSIHRLAMMCTETEGSHFKEYCKSTNKIFRKVIFF